MKSKNEDYAGYIPLLFIFSSFLLAQCSTLRTTPLPEAAPSVTSTFMAITNIPAENDIPTPGISPTPNVEMMSECIKIEEEPPIDLNISGVWIRNEGTPYLENLDENTTYTVPLEGGGLFSTRSGDMDISPDGKYLAYIDVYMNPEENRAEKRILRIIKSSGHVLNMNDWSVDWQWIIGWVDTQNIALFTGKKEIIILNPFTGAWNKLDTPIWMPSEYRYRYSYKNGGPYIPYYDYAPGLGWLLLQPDYKELQIRDAQSGETLWNLDNGQFTSSVDGSTLLVESGNMITLMTKQDREVSKFDLNELGVYFYEMVLSPNGKKIAFSGRQENSSREEFLIFDITHGAISKVCLNDYSLQSNFLSWSMDNRFVVIGIYDEQYNKYDLIVDTENMAAYKLVSGQYQSRMVFLALP